MKIITLNVEMNRHWDEIIPFLERELPEVLCVQEIFSKDVQMLEKRFGYKSLYLPMCNRWYGEENTSAIEDEGISLFTKLPIIKSGSEYYHKTSSQLHLYETKMPLEIKREVVHQGLVWAKMEFNNLQFTIINTHFTWTPNGKPNIYQDEDIKELMKILENISEFVLCGDLNIPRNENYIYNILAKKYKDNIPQNIKTTLDIVKHRINKNPIEAKRLATYVVDYIFSTPEYIASDVKCEFGLSDHAAVIAKVSKK